MPTTSGLKLCVIVRFSEASLISTALSAGDGGYDADFVA
jgi:hypothetical protein